MFRGLVPRHTVRLSGNFSEKFVGNPAETEFWLEQCCSEVTENYVMDATRQQVFRRMWQERIVAFETPPSNGKSGSGLSGNGMGEDPHRRTFMRSAPNQIPALCGPNVRRWNRGTCPFSSQQIPHNRDVSFFAFGKGNPHRNGRMVRKTEQTSRTR